MDKAESINVMGKYVIYTALVGKGYDNILQPKVVDNRFDYICFVKKGDKKEDYNGVWRIEEIESDIIDNIRLSRYPKMIPGKTCLKEYKYSLYIDANIVIKDKFVYDRFIELVLKEVPLALLQHPHVDCVYQDAYIVIAGCRASWTDVIRQILFLKWKKYPTHNGFYEANVIFRKNNDEEVLKFGEIWWKTFLRFSKRDQLSIVYALNESGLHPDYFLPQGYCARNHYAFEAVNHIKQKETFSLKIKKKIVAATISIFRKALKD